MWIQVVDILEEEGASLVEQIQERSTQLHRALTSLHKKVYDLLYSFVQSKNVATNSLLTIFLLYYGLGNNNIVIFKSGNSGKSKSSLSLF